MRNTGCPGPGPGNMLSGQLEHWNTEHSGQSPVRRWPRFSGAEEYRATFSHRFPGSLTLLCRTFCPSLVFISFPHGTDQSALLVSFRFKTFTTNYPAPEGVLSFLPRTAHAPGEARCSRGASQGLNEELQLAAVRGSDCSHSSQLVLTTLICSPAEHREQCYQRTRALVDVCISLRVKMRK